MKFEEFEQTGIFTNGITVDELIKSLEDYKDVYGSQPIQISLEGDRDCHVEFDYFKNALTIDVREER